MDRIVQLTGPARNVHNFFSQRGLSRGIASRKQVRGPHHNMLTIANVNQDIETILKEDKSEGAMAPLGPIVAMPMGLSTINFPQDTEVFIIYRPTFS